MWLYGCRKGFVEEQQTYSPEEERIGIGYGATTSIVMHGNGQVPSLAV